MAIDTTKKIVFVNTHPIQYFAPLYQKMATYKEIDLEVLYLSTYGMQQTFDKEFNTKLVWDIPLLDGYQYRVLKNHSFSKASFGFWSFVNWGIIKYLYKKEKSIIIFHGWAHFSNVLGIFFAKLFRHTVCIRSETPLNQELLKSKGLVKIKNVLLRFLFLFVDKFLYIGSQNKAFYKNLGVKDKNLVYTPYAIDNNRFTNFANTISKREARDFLKLQQNESIVLFSAKYIEKKRPLDLIHAIAQLKANGNTTNLKVLFVGEGILRGTMEKLIDEKDLNDSIVLTGFINQLSIPYYYAAADIFVMTSDIGETWGLSVNEAMNFGLPVVISSTPGSAYDLVEKDENGFVFPTGNINELSSAIELLLSDKKKQEKFGARSKEIIKSFSFECIIGNLIKTF